MNIREQFRRLLPKDVPLQVIPRTSWAGQRPTYRDAEPAVIEAALRRSQRRPTGNWYAFAASREVRSGRPFGAHVAGVEVVAWRDRLGRLRVGPRSCPHLGADLATGIVHDGALICRWHGLALGGAEREFGWCPFPGHDDGTLVWVRLDKVGGEEPSDEPVIPVRPTGGTLTAVTRMVGVCEPTDIIANRLDPWHGAWFHPYSFTALEVLTTPTEHADRFLVAVTFRMGRSRRTGHRGVHLPGGTHRRDAHRRRRGGRQHGRNSCHTNGFGSRWPSPNRRAGSQLRAFRTSRIQACDPGVARDLTVDALRGRPSVARRPRLCRAPVPGARLATVKGPP